MSGSGGGGGGGGGLSGPTSVDCSTLIFRTTLNSPNPTAVSSVRVRDRLSIEVEGDRGPILARNSNGQTVGSITAREMVDLIRCIQEGTEYIGIVRSIAGGRVEIEVRPVSP